jgi:hypothetical protein
LLYFLKKFFLNNNNLIKFLIKLKNASVRRKEDIFRLHLTIMIFHLVIFKNGKKSSMYKCARNFSLICEEETELNKINEKFYTHIFLANFKSTCVMLRMCWTFVDDEDKGKLFMYTDFFSSHSYNIGKLDFRDRSFQDRVKIFIYFFSFFTQFFVYILIEKFFSPFTFTFRF